MEGARKHHVRCGQRAHADYGEYREEQDSARSPRLPHKCGATRSQHVRCVWSTCIGLQFVVMGGRGCPVISSSSERNKKIVHLFILLLGRRAKPRVVHCSRKKKLQEQSGDIHFCCCLFVKRSFSLVTLQSHLSYWGDVYGWRAGLLRPCPQSSWKGNARMMVTIPVFCELNSKWCLGTNLVLSFQVSAGYNPRVGTLTRTLCSHICCSRCVQLL